MRINPCSDLVILSRIDLLGCFHTDTDTDRKRGSMDKLLLITCKFEIWKGGAADAGLRPPQFIYFFFSSILLPSPGDTFTIT